MLHIHHQVAYALLSSLYMASCLGLDKTVVGMAVAVAYGMLALARPE